MELGAIDGAEVATELLLFVEMFAVGALLRVALEVAIDGVVVIEDTDDFGIWLLLELTAFAVVAMPFVALTGTFDGGLAVVDRNTCSFCRSCMMVF